MSGHQGLREGAAPARGGGTADGGAPAVAGYRDLVPIGSGGFSRVYRAYQEAYDRTVAVKVLTVGLDDELSERFVRECALTGRLTGHPHVVTILDSGTTGDGRPFITTDYYARGSLTQVVRSQGPLGVGPALAIGVKIAGALETAHRCGIHHRDVKPQNILLSAFGEPALGDFGISTALLDRADASITTGALTMVHAPPEVLDGDIDSATGDVYSLASSLYCVLAGHPAFAAGDSSTGRAGVARLVQRILEEPLPPLERADVPDELDAVLRRAMAKAPGDRFPTALGLAEALQQVEQACSLSPTAVVCPPPGGEWDLPADAAGPGGARSGPDALPGLVTIGPDDLPDDEPLVVAVDPGLGADRLVVDLAGDEPDLDPETTTPRPRRPSR